MRIRPFEEEDRPAVVDLWRRVGLYRPWNDPDRDIDRKLADSPWGMLVGVEEVAPAEAPGPAGECVIATMMVGYDGHRGSVFYLAVDPAHQGQGRGTALMDHAEAMLLERGCPKAHASVRGGNHAVIGFYEARGYQVEDSAHAVSSSFLRGRELGRGGCLGHVGVPSLWLVCRQWLGWLGWFGWTTG